MIDLSSIGLRLKSRSTTLLLLAGLLAASPRATAQATSRQATETTSTAIPFAELGAKATVRAMAVDGGGNLVVGGDFTLIGAVVANRIAKWNGSAWSALGSGMNQVVHSLTVSGSDLYAGGF